jgi:hypothetical protein
MSEIKNENLNLSHIPSLDASIGEKMEFALTFDGYEECGSFDECAEIANSRNHDSLTNLRACLFFEQRRDRFGSNPFVPGGDDCPSYIDELIAKIRDTVTAAN